jgi:hypothetical protein
MGDVLARQKKYSSKTSYHLLLALALEYCHFCSDLISLTTLKAKRSERTLSEGPEADA